MSLFNPETPQRRDLSASIEAVTQQERTVLVCFSSEAPVERYWGTEILLHSPDNIDLSRLEAGGAFLVGHDPDDQIGVVESIHIGEDKKARALIRFSESQRADDIYKDVVAGIRRNISVGYFILDAREELEDGHTVLRVTRWMPFEISTVSIPADISVGVGRSQMCHNKKDQRMSHTATEQETTPTKSQEAELQQAMLEASKREQERVKSIYTAGKRFGFEDLADQAVRDNWDTEQFQRELLNTIDQTPTQSIKRAESPDIGMSEGEIHNYSFRKLINALAHPNDKRAQKEAAFELDCASAAFEKRGKNDKEGSGFTIPHDVLTHQRAVEVSGTGSNVVDTSLLVGSFIDLLRSNSILLGPGFATLLTGLTGNLAIPKMTGGATGYWLDEEEPAPESTPTFGQVTMQPTTMGTFVDLSRRLLKQSSMDVEMMIRRDLAQCLAITLGTAAINGTGAGHQITGILNTVGIGSVAMGPNGGPLTYDAVIDLETAVAVDDALMGNLSYITNPAVRGAMKKTAIEAGDATKIITALDYGIHSTTQVPSNLTKGTAANVCSALMFGNWSDLLIGMWGGLDLNIDTSTGSRAGTVRVVALQDVDIAVRHVESFAAIQDITA